jgi:hypothetical protein
MLFIYSHIHALLSENLIRKNNNEGRNLVLMYEDISRSFQTGLLERELQMIQLSATRCSCIAILWVRLVSFAAISLCVASWRVFIISVVYFVIDSVRKLLDISSTQKKNNFLRIPLTFLQSAVHSLANCTVYIAWAIYRQDILITGHSKTEVLRICSQHADLEFINDTIKVI